MLYHVHYQSMIEDNFRFAIAHVCIYLNIM